MNIEVGTSGYHYKDWNEVLYNTPEKKNNMLKAYSDILSTIEINYTYYKMPEEKELFKLQKKANKDLNFSIKINKLITHDRTDLHKNSSLFLNAVSNLTTSRHMNAILFQFPYSFHYTPDNRKYLASLLDIFSGLPCCVEFRNAEWSSQNVIREFAKRRVALCSTDMPDLPGLSPQIDIPTADFAYLRLHGRNPLWWKGDATSRYAYHYSEKELESIAARIRNIASVCDKVFVYFNNHWKGSAVINALRLKEML